MKRSVSLLLCMAFFLGGCAKVQDFGSSVKYNIQGEYYLQEKKFQQGSKIFSAAISKEPQNPEAHYYYGRFLLAEDKTDKALPHLQQAVSLDPGKSKYHFWLGVAQGEMGKVELERRSYNEALLIDPKNTQALTYLGNNLLKAGKYEEALEYYARTLELNHFNPQALYNRAVILRKQGRLPEEKDAWLKYLHAYPAGSFARRAADRLNSLGDHSYRNHRLGVRTVTLSKIDFVPFSDMPSSRTYPSLNLVGATVANMPEGVLNIIVYQLNNRELARKRALNIGNYLAKQFPDLKKNNRIRLSWFDVPEKRTVLNTPLRLNESVRFFLTDFKNSDKKTGRK
ncbi:tetratricopeptide repeat protein [Desulfopila inferna]|uniref:tetratricopeptide repeat protein n=1 Tax=Desulfopila inferna TaxID=468528 RepID=UPI001963A374|nr:tetratricopeptide repeat protein [Desulfopila inferna]MBM9605280.1 tetratricopeptide repeat protein [Desulfopila inferna]